jgi:hypothetical protein
MFDWVSSRRYAKDYLKGVTNEYRKRVQSKEWLQEDWYWEGIAKKNPGARMQDREDKVFSLSGVKLCNNQL